jgi:hypothetical protein
VAFLLLEEGEKWMVTLVQEKEMATTAHMKTIDGDYCDGYYGWKRVKMAAVF